MRIPPIALAALALLVVGGCAHRHEYPDPAPQVVVRERVVVKEKGPPPHAPAHGYRRKHHHHNLDLVFDSGLGVYVVVDLPDHYFHADRFYRWDGRSWYVSGELLGRWVPTRVDGIPKGLRKAGKHAHKKGRGRGHGPPAKHGY